jgi:type II restriction/modification system DNA methylase subunit YeeA
MFVSGGSAGFPCNGGCADKLTAFLCSKVASHYVKTLSATMNIEVGTVASIPFAPDNSPPSVEQEAISLAKEDWDNSEVSWDFQFLPLLRNDLVPNTLAHAWQSWHDRCNVNNARMRVLEERNNRLFIEAYGLEDELSPEVPLEQITLTCNPVYRYGPGRTEEEYEQRFREDTMKEFASYAIGCMMGRYSLDHPGLIFAGGDFEEVRKAKSEEADLPDVYQSFAPDDDGIIPILEDAYFEDDCTNRLIRFLKVTFAPDTLNENLAFIAEALGKKKSETPTDAIRRYLATKFYKDHLKTYKNRPIYWLVSSGKQRAFQALIYMHRYTPATLSRMRTSYLHELQNKLRSRMDDLEAGIAEASSTAEKNRLTKELAKLHKQQAELIEFDEKLHHYADRRIPIDLDDGVKHNYGLFGDLLAEVKAVTGGKEE